MSAVGLPNLRPAGESTAPPVASISRRSYEELARRVRLFSWLSLFWMTIAGTVAIAAGIAAVVVREGLEAWRGEGCCARSPLEGTA